MNTRYPVLSDRIPPSGRAVTPTEINRLRKRLVRVPRGTIVKRAWDADHIGALYCPMSGGGFGAMGVSVTLAA